MNHSTYVRPRTRDCSFVMLTVLVTMAATLLTAAEASASIYVWKADVSGDWTVAANWINSNNDPDGYPNDPDDVAIIATLGADARIISIPEGVTVTVREISFAATQKYFISGGFSVNRGTLVLKNGSAAKRPSREFGAPMSN